MNEKFVKDNKQNPTVYVAKKSGVTSLLLVITLLLTLLPMPVSAIGSNTFRFANYPQENIAFTLEDGSLTVTNLPDAAIFRSVWVHILNEDLLSQADEVLTRKKDGSVSMSLRSLEDGDYFISLYFLIGGDSYASYVFGDDVCFHWQNGIGTFVESPTLEHNREAFESGRTDDAALAYYLAPTYSTQSTDAAIVALASELASGLADDYEKALAIHDWVCANIWYDSDAAGSGKRIEGDAVSTLNSRRAVCAGYATLTAALLRAVGIPAKIVSGYGLDASMTSGWTEHLLSGAEANHSWNEAYIDGRWIIIDTTWDCDNEYREGRKVRSGGIHSYRYFDAALEAFSVDHRIEDYEESIIPPPDDPSPWAIEQVNIAISAELVPRILRTEYTQAITRAEFCALAVTLYENVTGRAITEHQAFTDTNDVNVEKAAAIGVANGVGDNKFDPDDTLTREQAATMLARLADAIGVPLKKQPAPFADNDSISLWALEAVGQLQTTGIMGGVGGNIFSPKADYSREQGIIVIIRLYELIRSMT